MTDKAYKKTKSNEKGLTLLELTVALSLFGIISVIVLNLMYYGFRSNKAVKSKVEIINNLNSALEVITKAIRSSNASDLEIVEDSPNFKTLVYSETDASGNKKICKLQVKNGVLQKDVSGVTQDLTTKEQLEVIFLDFEKGNNNDIDIDITVKSNDGGTVTARSNAAVRSGI